MRVYIARGTDQFTSDEICTESTYSAFYGFSLMGTKEMERANPVFRKQNMVMVMMILNQNKVIITLEENGDDGERRNR